MEVPRPKIINTINFVSDRLRALESEESEIWANVGLIGGITSKKSIIDCWKILEFS
jgi:hypothetical protein